MRELLDDPVRTAPAEDRVPYVLGTLPSLDHPHHVVVVVTMLVETGNNAAADGLTGPRRARDPTAIDPLVAASCNRRSGRQGVAAHLSWPASTAAPAGPRTATSAERRRRSPATGA